ncbi:MAG: hypothetical protein LBM74_05425 [Oscillospiraceae bacterium]|jgi:hypothetical protein|nr:hypothetical protein [Oscillospiraceae bacterium]
MDNQTTVNIYDPMAVRRAGLEALQQCLGIEGMVYFLQQFGGGGRGDYTAERDAMQEDISLEEAFAQVQALDALRRGDRIRDYTAERHTWLDGISREELIAQARALDALRRGEVGQSAE